jgi:hypothetical protein
LFVLFCAVLSDRRHSSYVDRYESNLKVGLLMKQSVPPRLAPYLDGKDGGRWCLSPEGLWGCSVVGAAVVVHPWGAAGGGASSLEGRWRRFPTREALAAALAAARQRDYGGGAVGAVGGGSASLGWRWQVSYVGASAAAPWEQLDNQLDCDGSKTASMTKVTAGSRQSQPPRCRYGGGTDSSLS